MRRIVELGTSLELSQVYTCVSSGSESSSKRLDLPGVWRQGNIEIKGHEAAHSSFYWDIYLSIKQSNSGQKNDKNNYHYAFCLTIICTAEETTTTWSEDSHRNCMKSAWNKIKKKETKTFSSDDSRMMNGNFTNTQYRMTLEKFNQSLWWFACKLLQNFDALWFILVRQWTVQEQQHSKMILTENKNFAVS